MFLPCYQLWPLTILAQDSMHADVFYMCHMFCPLHIFQQLSRKRKLMQPVAQEPAVPRKLYLHLQRTQWPSATSPSENKKRKKRSKKAKRESKALQRDKTIISIFFCFGLGWLWISSQVWFGCRHEAEGWVRYVTTHVGISQKNLMITIVFSCVFKLAYSTI